MSCNRTSSHKWLLLSFFSHVKGLHLNFFPVSAPYGPFSYVAGYLWYHPKERMKIFPLMERFLNVLRETGYFHLQGTQ